MILLVLLLASSIGAANPIIVSEFERTCVASRTRAALESALSIEGWKVYPKVAESHLAREIELVSPMLEAQGLASDYIIYSFDSESSHFELALSETRKPVSGQHKLIGCSLYDFEAIVPVDSAAIGAFSPKIAGQRSKFQDVQVEKWDNPFGQGSGMRAVFVPVTSPMKAQLGFSGMMLGTHFLDQAD